MEILMSKTDRRVQQTRERLQKALIDLLSERDYEAITIQDIVDRARIGRTTFYLHYNSKDELFVSCHDAIIREFHIGARHGLSREQFLSPEPPDGMISAYTHLREKRALLYSVFQGRESLSILRQIRLWNAKELQENLRAVFAEAESAIPFDLLANYLAGAQIAMLQWWLEKSRTHTAESLARTFHRLQRAAILDAFGLSNNPHNS
jgi:AcrR family transcriptional regulator